MIVGLQYLTNRISLDTETSKLLSKRWKMPLEWRNYTQGKNFNPKDFLKHLKHIASIVDWPKGYDTQVGERGLKLSGNFKKKVF